MSCPRFSFQCPPRAADAASVCNRKYGPLLHKLQPALQVGL
jgi:hypothetical protein